MTALTPANQLTLLRMLLIPAFVILVLYGELGWALGVFVTAGATDALDGLIARRSGQKTQLGAWLDPMADKLLLVTTFIVLTLPGLVLANPLPVWLTVLVISRDVVIVLTVWLAVGLTAGAWYFWPIWPILGAGIGVISHAIPVRLAVPGLRQARPALHGRGQFGGVR